MAEFVPLAAWLRDAERADEVMPAPEIGAASSRPSVVADDAAVGTPHTAMLGDLALVRLAAIEAFERASRRLLEALAADVLGRELVLAPIDVDALVATALASFAAHEPLALALCADDARRVRSPLPIRVDPSLASGDLVVDVRDGSLEATFAYRVRDALARATEAAS